MGRILVAIDASPASRAAAEAAADLAAHLEAELEGVFVRDRKLLALAGSPLARRLDLLTAAVSDLELAELERELGEQAERARALLAEIASRAGVVHRFRVAQGAVAEEIERAAGPADLVTLGLLGFTSRARSEIGSTLRALLARRHAPTLVLERWSGIRAPVRVLFGGSEAALRALELGGRIARAAGQRLEVLLLGQDADELGRAAAAALGEAPPDVAWVPLAGHRPAAVVGRLAAGGHGLVLLPADLPGLDPRQILDEIGAPVLLIGA